MENKLEVSLSKKKIVFFIIAGLVFVIIGFFGALKPEYFLSPLFRNPDVIQISGIIGVCFFGLGLIFLLRKLTDNKPGLIIDQNGITDNTNATSVGLIEWNDITGIERRQVMSNKFLIIHTDVPEKYLSRAKNIISRKAMELNYKSYGSPISIISNSLKIDFEDLEKIILSELADKGRVSN